LQAASFSVFIRFFQSFPVSSRPFLAFAVPLRIGHSIFRASIQSPVYDRLFLVQVLDLAQVGRKKRGKDKEEGKSLLVTQQLNS